VLCHALLGFRGRRRYPKHPAMALTRQFDFTPLPSESSRSTFPRLLDFKPRARRIDPFLENSWRWLTHTGSRKQTWSNLPSRPVREFLPTGAIVSQQVQSAHSPVERPEANRNTRECEGPTTWHLVSKRTSHICSLVIFAVRAGVMNAEVT
jgi:hypothetical protein